VDGDDALPRTTKGESGGGDDFKCDFWFRGGCTLLISARTGAVRYVIRKSVKDQIRLDRQRRFMSAPEAISLRATYFGGSVADVAEPFAMLHAETQ